MATIAMMEEELIRKRQWFSTTRFTEMVSVCKLLPGPVATQMAIYLGFERSGIPGGLFAGIFFILPSFLLVLVLSYFYTIFGAPQKFSAIFLGMQAGALSVILISLLQLARPYREKQSAWLIASVSAIVVGLSPRWEPLVILFWGLAGGFFYAYCEGLRHKLFSFGGLFLFLILIFVGGLGLNMAGEKLLLQIFWVCFKAGAFVFGTGLAVVPVLEADVVQRFHWLTHHEFMDGLAIGQITPGPYVITATFIGFKAAGWLGALASTFGIFLPAFINILYIVPRIWNKVSGSRFAFGFSAWAIPAVIGGIFGSFVHLGQLTLLATPIIFIFLFVLFASIKLKIPAWALIPIAGVMGALLG